MKYSRQTELSANALVSVPVRQVVARALQPLTVRMANRRIVVDLDVPSDLEVVADAGQLATAIGQLVENAIHRMPTGGEITITALENDWNTLIEVADEGPEHQAADPGHLLDFLAAKDQGTAAWDLREVRRTVSMHGGTLEVQDCPEGGTAYTVCLPRRQRRAAA